MFRIIVGCQMTDKKTRGFLRKKIQNMHATFSVGKVVLEFVHLVLEMVLCKLLLEHPV